MGVSRGGFEQTPGEAAAALMAVAGDCNKCGFPVDEGTQVMLGEQLLHPGCHGRGAPRRAWRNTDGGASQSYGRKTRSRSPPSLSMESADKGVGALYIVMDALKRRRAEEKEKEEKQRAEEEFHNKMNRGRQILPPL